MIYDVAVKMPDETVLFVLDDGTDLGQVVGRSSYSEYAAHPRVMPAFPVFNIKPVSYDVDEEFIENMLMNRLWHKRHRRFKESDAIRDAIVQYIEIMDDALGTLWMWRPVLNG
jgi:cysteinyl-tRNA synthetase